MFQTTNQVGVTIPNWMDKYKMFLTTKQQGFEKDLRWILQHKKCWINGGIIINFRLASSKKNYHAKMKDICYKL